MAADAARYTAHGDLAGKVRMEAYLAGSGAGGWSRSKRRRCASPRTLLDQFEHSRGCILGEGSDLEMARAQRMFYVICRAVSQPEPDDLWGETPHDTHITEVSILGHNNVVVCLGVLPDRTIWSLIQANEMDMAPWGRDRRGDEPGEVRGSGRTGASYVRDEQMPLASRGVAQASADVRLREVWEVAEDLLNCHACGKV